MKKPTASSVFSLLTTHGTPKATAPTEAPASKAEARPNPSPVPLPPVPVPLSPVEPKRPRPQPPSTAPGPTAPKSSEAPGAKGEKDLHTEVREAHAAKNPLLTVACMNLLNAGPHFPGRLARLKEIAEALRARRFFTKQAEQELEAMGAAIIKELGYDPRVQQPPAPAPAARPAPRPLPAQLEGCGDGAPTPRELCAMIQSAHRQGHVLAVAEFLNTLAAGPRSSERAAELATLALAKEDRGWLKPEEQAAQRIAEAIVEDLAWDPRTEAPPGPPPRPYSGTLTAAVLNGDTERLLSLVSEATEP